MGLRDSFAMAMVRACGMLLLFTAVAMAVEEIDEESVYAQRKADLARIATEDAQVEAEKRRVDDDDEPVITELIQEKEDMDVPPTWRRLVNPEGNEYWWNQKTGYTTWDRPTVSTGAHKAVAAQEAEWLANKKLSGDEDFESQDLSTLQARNDELLKEIAQQTQREKMKE